MRLCQACDIPAARPMRGFRDTLRLPLAERAPYRLVLEEARHFATVSVVVQSCLVYASHRREYQHNSGYEHRANSNRCNHSRGAQG